ncbi:MAG TPA: polysaccharide deacetylase family protein [Sphingobacteriaceae bacterium]
MNLLYIRPVLILLVLVKAAHGQVTEDKFGAIVRGDTSKKELALVFTGDEFADGGKVIRRTLNKNSVRASFFFTGRFYANREFGSLIKGLRKDGHYLGAHSDDHLLYCDWTKRDSLLVTEEQFRADLRRNYQKMAGFGIQKNDAEYFLPPYEWYNLMISKWTGEEDLKLVNFTHGTRSTADYTYPEMGKSYRSSEEIYRSIFEYEAKDKNGLNGFILLIHIGTDPRRTDKLYNRLDAMIRQLKGMGYRFKTIDELLN